MKKNISQYYIVYERDERGGYVASVPAVPGCAVYGKTLAVAHKRVQSALEECLEVLEQFGKKAPKETVRPELVRKFSFTGSPVYARR
jgi:predicted RNase H-like HicB family nuclease